MMGEEADNGQTEDFRVSEEKAPTEDSKVAQEGQRSAEGEAEQGMGEDSTQTKNMDVTSKDQDTGADSHDGAGDNCDSRMEQEDACTTEEKGEGKGKEEPSADVSPHEPADVEGAQEPQAEEEVITADEGHSSTHEEEAREEEHMGGKEEEPTAMVEAGQVTEEDARQTQSKDVPTEGQDIAADSYSDADNGASHMEQEDTSVPEEAVQGGEEQAVDEAAAHPEVAPDAPAQPLQDQQEDTHEEAPAMLSTDVTPSDGERAELREAEAHEAGGMEQASTDVATQDPHHGHTEQPKVQMRVLIEGGIVADVPANAEAASDLTSADQMQTADEAQPDGHRQSMVVVEEEGFLDDFEGEEQEREEHDEAWERIVQLERRRRQQEDQAHHQVEVDEEDVTP
jgi:hypothetical protein